jgi:hypothetical protein
MMADENPGRALGMVRRVEQMCEFIEHPAIKAAVEGAVPVSMPRAPGALGFDISLWAGLGTVSLWAALQTFSGRAGLGGGTKCHTCKSRNCIVARFSSRVQGDDRRSLGELEDLRQLYAHNYAGEADDDYFAHKPRHVLAPGRVELTCGAEFDGRRAQLNLSHLRNYCGIARRVLEAS